MPINPLSRPRYYQLVGLLALAERHNERLREIEQACASLLCAPSESTGDHPYFGHISDAVYEGYGADALLSRLQIAVTDDANEKDR